MFWVLVYNIKYNSIVFYFSPGKSIVIQVLAEVQPCPEEEQVKCKKSGKELLEAAARKKKEEEEKRKELDNGPKWAKEHEEKMKNMVESCRGNEKYALVLGCRIKSTSRLV